MTTYYWLFTCTEYYPHGGMDDLVKTFDKLEEAQDCAKEKFDMGAVEADWAQIVFVENNLPIKTLVRNSYDDEWKIKVSP